MSTNASPRRHLPAWLIWIGVPAVIAGLAFAWWAISPLFISTKVEEAFPTVAAPAAQARAPTAAPPQAAAQAANAPAQAAAQPAASPAPATPAEAEQEAAPAGPVALASGSFTVIDRLHGAEGTATIYELAGGERILRLENFAAQNGPDLRIGLSGHPMPRSSAELHDTGPGYVELAGLKASEGSQNYEIPGDLDLSGYQSVVIYCRAFSVMFSSAELISAPGSE